jgi:5-methylcytosine-specific restriction endonuclease McrA
MATAKQEKSRLLASALAVIDLLEQSDLKAALKIRLPGRVAVTNTDGWRAIIAQSGQNQPRLELWLDRFSGHANRRYFACFYSKTSGPMSKLVGRVKKKLLPVHTHTADDADTDNFFRLNQPLSRSLFAKPILERYSGENFFGLYDPASRAGEASDARFCQQAAAFFLEVLASLPRNKALELTRTNYPRCENRKRVEAHLRRERNGLLAAQCKERDRYCCQVCGDNFEKLFGKLGCNFAEAHHKVPLGKLGNKVATSLDDLVTVCANCHRMLHRMEGTPEDIATLRKIVRRRRT